MRKLKLTVASFVLFVLPAIAQAEDSTFLVLLNQNPSAIKNFANSVESAGGSVKFVIEEIGVGFATSSDPKFMTKLSRKAGIQGVGYSLPVLMEETNSSTRFSGASMSSARRRPGTQAQPVRASAWRYWTPVSITITWTWRPT
jgi:hypothetical protein